MVALSLLEEETGALLTLCTMCGLSCVIYILQIGQCFNLCNGRQSFIWLYNNEINICIWLKVRHLSCVWEILNVFYYLCFGLKKSS